MTINSPKDLNKYEGQFIVFFPDETDPKVLFSSPIPDLAYKKAKEIKEAQQKEPVVIRVQQENAGNSNAHLASII